MAKTETKTRPWKTARFNSDDRLTEFLAALEASDGAESVDRAKVVSGPWGYSVFYPERA